MLASGVAGKQFVGEITKWMDNWNHDSLHYKTVSLKIAMIMPALLTQLIHCISLSVTILTLHVTSYLTNSQVVC